MCVTLRLDIHIRDETTVVKLAGSRDDEFRSGVQTRAGIIERVDRGIGVKVEIGPPIDAFQQMPQWLKEGADITEALIGGEIEGVEDDAAGAFNAFLESEAAADVSEDYQSYVADIRGGVAIINQILQKFEVSEVNVAETAPEVPEAFDVDIEQLQDTLLDLRRVPGSVGDTVVVRGRLSTPGRETIETSATFELTRFGHYARLVPSVVLVRPDEIASGEDEFRFAPALGWMHHYRPRPTDTGWWANTMRPLQASAGLHAIFLNFDNEAGIGLGGTISFWNERLQFGGGYNLSASSSDEGEYYFFIGSDLIGLLQAVGLGE